MSQTSLDRRSLLRTAGVGALAVGATAATATAASASTSSTSTSSTSTHHADGLLGAWLIEHSDNTDPTPVRAVTTFAGGGVFQSLDIDPPMPAGLGAWERSGDNRFKVLFWIGQPGSDSQPSAQIRIRVNGQWNDDHISGSFTGTFFSGGKALGTFHGTFHGHRIEP
jgi:hypothetical protein